jgi:Na+:H+ antiporter
MVIVVIGVVELLLLASLSAVVFRRVGFPYTIGLVIVGILLAVAQDRLHVLEPIQHIRLGVRPSNGGTDDTGRG